ncbi:MAG: alpha-amylase/4-alpha-glucanotransferase domain-containing protein [Chloroflexota bacterium]|nr:alpha-amylase/4-alpha-glucanotransferase domain-containing protein [Chloroflexota bacterium]
MYLSLVFHNHQPVGNFENVFAEGYQKAYEPLVALMERHPTVNAAMHFTGPLRDWLLTAQPAFMARVRALVERGQLEMLGGAYYEPILVMLSDEDKIGQLNLLSDAVAADFGVRPSGMWLAERIWEPSLARPIQQAGLKYAIVDDTHFNNAGFDDAELFGYYVTEEQGAPLNLFASSKDLRYLFPWRQVDEVIDWLRGQDAAHRADLSAPPIALMGDDGEKFGMWQGTWDHCWGSGYMDRFFEAIERNADWLHTITPGGYMRQFPARGRAYLPTASYLEMTEWALPAARMSEITRLRRDIEREIDSRQTSDAGRAAYLKTLLRNMRGGFWRGFLAKYPEVNHMQKRGAYTSRHVHPLPDSGIKRDALKKLWAAQCNCAYWHGVFGGIYLFHIRAANYANILAAEALITGDKPRLAVETLDFDLDGRDEIVVSGSPFALILAPSFGGALIEWDDLPSRVNLLNVLSRHREGYHEALAAAAGRGDVITPADWRWNLPENVHTTWVRAKRLGLEANLVVDWHRRASFIDHFLGAEVTLAAFAGAAYTEAGDFVLGAYESEVSGGGDRAVVTLKRDGRVWVEGVHQPVRVEKRLTVAAGERDFTVDYTVTNLATAALTLRFGIETVYGLEGGDSELCFVALPNGAVSGLSAQTTSEGVSHYRVGTRIRQIEIVTESAQSGALWRFPLAPVSMSDGGFEQVYQGTVCLHLFAVSLAPGASWTNSLRMKVSDLA